MEPLHLGVGIAGVVIALLGFWQLWVESRLKVCLEKNQMILNLMQYSSQKSSFVVISALGSQTPPSALDYALLRAALWSSIFFCISNFGLAFLGIPW